MRSPRLTLAAVMAVLAAGGAAYAYFTATGSADGPAGTGTVSAEIVATTGTPSTLLYPGSPAGGDVTLQVDNTSSAAVTLVSVALTTGGTITADAGHPGCTTTGVSFINQTGLSIRIAAGTTQQIDLPGAASMSTASSSGCQGATFSIPVTVTVES